MSFGDTYELINNWVENHGWITIGSDDYYDSWIRVFNDGGLIVEIDEGENLNEAFAVLEAYFKNDFEEEWGYEL
ncbi:MAG: hypothetical protein WBA17_11845 [Saprospiraceae bacterium]